MKKIGEMTDWTLDVQCNGGFWQDEIPCGDSFQITEADLAVESVIVMFETPVKVIGFICPTCGSFTEIHMDKIPKVVKNRVLAKYRGEKKEERKQNLTGLMKFFEPMVNGFKDLKAQIFK